MSNYENRATNNSNYDNELPCVDSEVLRLHNNFEEWNDTFYQSLDSYADEISGGKHDKALRGNEHIQLDALRINGEVVTAFITENLSESSSYEEQLETGGILLSRIHADIMPLYEKYLPEVAQRAISREDAYAANLEVTQSILEQNDPEDLDGSAATLTDAFVETTAMNSSNFIDSLAAERRKQIEASRTRWHRLGEKALKFLNSPAGGAVSAAIGGLAGALAYDALSGNRRKRKI